MQDDYERASAPASSTRVDMPFPRNTFPTKEFEERLPRESKDEVGSDMESLVMDIAELIDLIESNKISNTAATNTILPKMLSNNLSANYIANKHNLIQESNEDVLHQYIRQAIEKYPDKVKEYKNGKKGLIGLFMGEVMKLSKGKADPKLANTLLKNILEK